MIKAVIFDMDGVLIDSEKLKYEKWKRIAKIEIEEEYFKKECVGKSREIVCGMIIKKYNLAITIEELAEKIKSANVELYKRENIIPIITAINFLKRIQKKYKIALASSQNMAYIIQVLEILEIKDYFENNIFSGHDSVKIDKPEPYLYLFAAEKMNLKPEECLVIEDSETGVLSAKNAGMFCIAVPNEFTKYQDFTRADLVLNSLDGFNIQEINLKKEDKKIKNINELKEISKQIRKSILEMLCRAGSGHPGGSLSCTDIIVALYFYKMHVDPKNPKLKDRDKFILSKGHACPALYAVLAEKGFFGKEELNKLRKINSLLQGHPSIFIPGIDASTGSLGQGLSIANGMAIASKLDELKNKIYVLLGDGEIQEGQIWEAAMTAAHYKLDNVIAILDNNKIQIDGFVDEIMNINPLKEKWEAFGWYVFEINGHDFNEIIEALDKADKLQNEIKKPVIIIADTVKGKSISFMEHNKDWHGKAPKKEEYEKAICEIKEEK
jgi:transketolase